MEVIGIFFNRENGNRLYSFHFLCFFSLMVSKGHKIF
jgi:hypothetical protein